MAASRTTATLEALVGALERLEDRDRWGVRVTVTAPTAACEGLSFRTYLLWTRLVRALEIFAGGKSLTEAAHGAGFSDSAHLSRTFHRMFGIVAASLRLS